MHGMKALVLKAYNEDLVMEDLPVPSPGAMEVLVKVHYCGICGTDLKITGGKLPGIITLPHVPGHEIAGEIAALGEGVKGLSVGDKGIAYIYTTCHDCELCRSGRENICYNLKRLGFELPGGFAEYVVMPAYNFCTVAPDSKLEEMAVLTDAVATPYHALKSIAPLREGQSVLIVGSGGLGLHAVQLAKLSGARVAVADVKKDSLEMAKQYGADLIINSAEVDPKKTVLDWTEGRGVDVVLEGVGRQSTVSWSLYCLKPGGTLVIMGYDPPNPITVNTKDMHYTEWKICGTRAATKQDLVELIALTEAGKLKPVVSTILPLEKTNEGLRAVAQGQTLGRIVIKVL
jgi:2-desacetyl-2-hydroxyethyl bacteriochlorophyllide A dehydrogenase